MSFAQTSALERTSPVKDEAIRTLDEDEADHIFDLDDDVRAGRRRRGGERWLFA